LFVSNGSGVEDDTEAAFVVATGAAFAATKTTRSTVLEAPNTSAPWVHETVVVPLHDQPDDVVDTKVMFGGNVSVTVRSAASDGPAFVVVSEYVTFAPATIGPT
jgi:hypothetical protein